MRHRKKGKKFSRMQGPRRSFVRNLANNLIRHGKMETTETRAKAIRPIMEKLVTLAKTNSVSRRRLIFSRVHDANIVKKIFDDIAPKYAQRHGGYLRITRLAGTRKRDGVRMARIEFV